MAFVSFGLRGFGVEDIAETTLPPHLHRVMVHEVHISD